MNDKKLILVILLAIVSWTTFSYSGNNPTQIIDKILFAQGQDELDAIEEIDKHLLRDEELISLYMELLDYYIGEGPGEILSEKITGMGERILPFLIEKKNSTFKCLDKYRPFCYKNAEERNVKIRSIIAAIKKGIILYAVFPEKLKTEVDQSMKIVRIFLEDFRRNKKTFPRDLNVLKEYVWQQYGYKLKIFNPWGEPFKYISKSGDKYTLEPGKGAPAE